MLRVLQHYFPVRTALLVAMETVLLMAVLSVGMTQHLWELLSDPTSASESARSVSAQLTRLSLLPSDGLQRCLLTAMAMTLAAQLSIGLNRLYEFQVSASRYERASRFVESAGGGIALCLVIVIVGRLIGSNAILGFPGLALTQTIQTLTASLAAGYALLYVARFAFHGLVRRADLDVRVLVLGSRGPAHALAHQIIEHPEAGFRVGGLSPSRRPLSDRAASVHRRISSRRRRRPSPTRRAASCSTRSSSSNARSRTRTRRSAASAGPIPPRARSRCASCWRSWRSRWSSSRWRTGARRSRSRTS